MALTCLRVLAIASVALYLVPTGAHLFELVGKMAMSPSEYMSAQQIYRGWSLFGFVMLLALLSIAIHAVARRHLRGVFILSLVAEACLFATAVVFWRFTYPMNVASNNWTVMPDQFEAARRQWEYSHAASAVLTFLALLAIAASVAVDVTRVRR